MIRLGAALLCQAAAAQATWVAASAHGDARRPQGGWADPPNSSSRRPAPPFRVWASPGGYDPPTSSRGRRPAPPFRVWASPFNFSSAEPPEQLASRFRGANILLNCHPSVTPATAPRYVAAGLTPLRWAYGPGASYPSHSCHNDSGPMVACLNATEAIAYYKQRLNPAEGSFVWAGAAIDEWGGGASHGNASALAAEGYRQARAAWPNNFVVSWVAGVKDENLVSLLRDGSIDLAIIEGYTYCPHARDAESCAGAGVESYYSILDWARSRGVLNRTIFSFGKMYAKGSPMTQGPAVNGSTEQKAHAVCEWDFCKGGGWTKQSIRAAALKIKRDFPEMPCGLND